MIQGTYNEVGLKQFQHVIDDAKRKGTGIIKLSRQELTQLLYTAVSYRSKVEEMQKALQRIDKIAESCGAEAHIVRKMVQEALKGESQ